MYKNVKVSIVMPIYNDEKYLNQCIDSILNQTFYDFELILVDDGSTDKSVEIEEDYVKRDSRVVLIKQKNQYAGIARNNGMKIANGKYILFLDSDDYFEPDMIESCYKKAEITEVDIILFNTDTYNEKTKKIIKRPLIRFKDNIYKKEVIKPKEISKTIFQNISCVPWTKFYKRSFIKENNLWFQGLHNSNDYYFTVVSLMIANKISIINKEFVHNRRGTGTNIQSNTSVSKYDFIKARESVYNYIIENNELEIYINSFKNTLINATIDNLCKINENKREVALRCNKMIGITDKNISEYIDQCGAAKINNIINNKKMSYIKYLYYMIISTINKIKVYGLKNVIQTAWAHYVLKMGMFTKKRKITNE